MPDPSFTNLLFTWLLLVFPVVYCFHSREWSHRWAIWTALWITLTPVDVNPFRDLVLMVVLFRMVEWLKVKVQRNEKEWRHRVRLERFKAQ